MLVIEVALALFTLITEFSRVRVRGSSWRGCSELKFFGNNLESSINSPERISFTSLGGSSCTESKVCWDVEEILLISFPLVPLTAVEFRVSWTAKGTFPSLDAFLSGTTAWEDGEEPVKAFTAALTAFFRPKRYGSACPGLVATAETAVGVLCCRRHFEQGVGRQ